jgi:hypothetical protein
VNCPGVARIRWRRRFFVEPHHGMRFNEEPFGTAMDAIIPRASKIGALRDLLENLLLEHKRDGMLPTNARFLWYELVQRGQQSKERIGARRPDQNLHDALTAVFGTLKTVVREFKVDVKPYAQYPIAARISFVEPRKRSWASYTITPDNLRFATVERAGQVLYDTRETVPCDMAQWSETYRKHRDQWLARQAEIDRENASAPAGVRTEQMGNFRDEEPDTARSGSDA